MAINKKLLHFKTFANFNSQKLSANEENTSYTIGVDGAVTSGAPVVRYESICWIKDIKHMWTHGQLYDCSGGNVTSDSPTFLRVGDADDEAKANFIAVANGEKSADYYICASSIIGVETNGVVPSLIFNGPSNNPEQVYYTFLGSPMRGQMKNKVLMITTTLTVSDNTITTTYEAVLDNKQDTLVSGTNIKTINGETVLGSGDLQITTGDDNVQADWNVSDTTSDAYIKNRTHYAEFSQVSIPSTINTNSWTRIQLSGIVGKTLYVRYSFSPSSIVAVATLSMDELGVERTLNSGPRFTIYRDSSSIFIKGNYSELHILEVSTVVNKLPDYFIPSNIARTSEIKTINGQSLIGTGDITISGGSSSGSSAYSEISHGTADTTFTLTPNTFNIWDEVSSLTLTLGAETNGVANEYLFQFTSGSTATTLSLPDDIKWAGGETPTIEDNKIYQISILKGLGSVLSWDAKVLIDNLCTYDGNKTVTFQYPVASDIYVYIGGSSISMAIRVPFSAGETTVTFSNMPDPGSSILAIDPAQDDTYNYIF